MKHDCETAPLTDKMKALLAIAGKVQKGGKYVITEDVERARSHGAADKEIHDTVLIAAVFCMANRYVDGLDTWQPRRSGMWPATGSGHCQWRQANDRQRHVEPLPSWRRE